MLRKPFAVVVLMHGPNCLKLNSNYFLMHHRILWKRQLQEEQAGRGLELLKPKV